MEGVGRRWKREKARREGGGEGEQRWCGTVVEARMDAIAVDLPFLAPQVQGFVPIYRVGRWAGRISHASLPAVSDYLCPRFVTILYYWTRDYSVFVLLLRREEID